MPRVLLLLPTSTYRTDALVRACEALRVEFVAACERANAVVGEESDGYLTLDFRDPGAAAEAVARYAERRPLDAVLPVDEDTAVVAAAVAERLGLPHNPRESVEAARDKFLFRRRLAGTDLTQPRFLLVAAEDALVAAASGLSYPVVLKPRHLSGSRGVLRADDPESFVEALERIRALLARPEIRDRDPALSGSVLVEEWVPGDELAWEGVFVEGELRRLALFDKPDMGDGPTFAETLYLTPSQRPAAEQSRIDETVRSAARHLGLSTGPVHAELRVGPAGPVLLEMAARSIGGRCSKALRFGSGEGTGLEEILLRAALGQDPGETDLVDGAMGVLMLPVERSGALREVRGQDRARAVPGVTGVEITAHCGMELVPLPEGSRYLGFVFARAGDPAAVESALREAWDRLELVLEGDPD